MMFTVMTLLTLYHISVISPDSLGDQLGKTGIQPKDHVQDVDHSDLNTGYTEKDSATSGSQKVYSESIKKQFDRLIVDPIPDKNAPGNTSCFINDLVIFQTSLQFGRTYTDLSVLVAYSKDFLSKKGRKLLLIFARFQPT